MQIFSPYVLLALALLHPASGQDQSKGLDNRSKPEWLTAAQPLVDKSHDPSSAAVRSARSLKFNTGTGYQLEEETPGTEPRGYLTSIADHAGGFNAMPITPSSIILVGEATEHQPYLSADHSCVYTELSVKVSEVFQRRKDLPSGLSKITITQRGGTVKLPNGKLLSSLGINGETLLQMNIPYLLFLSYSKPTDDYTVLRAWDISKDPPQVLDYDGHPWPIKLLPSEERFQSVTALFDQLRSRLR